MPFLENVTRGRGIPRERLEEVGEHYFLFGGRSPINDLNREFLAAVEEDFTGAGLDLPVYWGNRNWDPYLTEAVEEMRDDGVRRALCLLTSAYSSYSGCRQYRENLADAVGRRSARALRGWTGSGTTSTTRASWRPWSTRRSARSAELPAALAQRGPPPLRHPLDPRRDERGQRRRRTSPAPAWAASAYVQQHQSVVDQVGRAGAQPDRPPVPRPSWSTARAPARRACPGSSPTSATASTSWPRRGSPPWSWCRSASSPTTWRSSTTSTSRPPRPPRRPGVAFVRAATAGVDPRFVTMVRGLVLERAAVERARRPDRGRRSATLGPSWDVCPAGCCANARQPGRPALCGSDPVMTCRTLARTRRCSPSCAASRRPSRARRPRSCASTPRGPVSVADRKSSPADVVTEVDREAEALLRRRLARAAPRRRVPRRGGRSRRLGHRHHLGGRPDRRHRQLPLRHPAVRR